MTRAKKIATGRLWQAYPDGKPDSPICEGSRTACMTYLKTTGLWGAYKRGAYRIGQLIWEQQAVNQ